VTDDLSFPNGIAVTDSYIYWSDGYTGKIQRSNLDGTDQRDIVVGLTSPVGLAVVTSVPKPATLLLMGIGPAGFGFVRRRRLA
jgi:hypothetical protein